MLRIPSTIRVKSQPIRAHDVVARSRKEYHLSADRLAIIQIAFYLPTELSLGGLRNVTSPTECSMLQGSCPESPLLSSYVFDINASTFIASFTLTAESHYWPTRVAMWLFLTDSSSYPVKRSRQVNLRPRQSILPR